MFRPKGPISYNFAPPRGYPTANRRVYDGHRNGLNQYPDQFGGRRPAPFIAAPVLDELVSLELNPEATELPPYGNPDLPITACAEEIASAVLSNCVVIVTGQTSSGKTTQLPQIALRAGFDRISSTQPTRIATYAAAARIQAELSDNLGETAKGWVAHRTAVSNTVTEATKITLLTDGIETAEAIREKPFRKGELHVLDEVHLFNLNTEVALGFAAIRARNDPNARFVCTSATMDTAALADFFEKHTGLRPPIIEVPGRSYPVEMREEPASTVLQQTLLCAELYPGKNIMTILPGKQAITDTIDQLQRLLPKPLQDTSLILPLHSKLSKKDQDRVHETPEGIMIINSTNVAENSVTFDVDIVIDAGLEKQARMIHGVEALVEQPASQANIMQRAGRTSRLRPGGIHILTRIDEDTPFVSFQERREYPIPEIQRTDLSRSVLQLAAQGIDLANHPTPHRPEKIEIDRAKESLRILGALDAEGHITRLGLQMNRFSVRPSSGRMMAEAINLNLSTRAKAGLSAIVSALEVDGLPYFAPNAGRAWRELTQETSSDLLAQLDMFIAAQTMTNPELAENNLDIQNVKEARELYEKVSLQANVPRGTPVETPTQQERQALKRCVYAGLIDYVYRHVGDGKYQLVGDAEGSTTRELSDRSVVRGHPRFVVGRPYRIVSRRGAQLSELDILESVTTIDDIAALGEVGQALCSWEPTSLAWSNGRLMRVAKLTFKGLEIGGERLLPAEPSPEAQQQVTDRVIALPGSAQQELRGIKRTLERLRHQAKDPEQIPQLKQDEFLKIIHAAATGILDPSIVEARLREQRITLDSYISPEDRAKIENNAPEEVAVGEATLSLTYQNGKPLVKKFTPEVVRNLPDNFELPDGRPILFVHQRRKRTIRQLRQLLFSDS